MKRESFSTAESTAGDMVDVFLRCNLHEINLNGSDLGRVTNLDARRMEDE